MSMRVNVVLSGLIHDAVGAIKLEIELKDGSTVGDLVNKIVEMSSDARQLILDGSGKLRRECLVLVNGRDIEWLDGLDTVLHNGDIVLMALKVFLA